MNIDPFVDSTLKTSQAISEFGILVVIAAVFLISVFWLVRFFVSSMRKTNEQMISAQGGINDNIKMLLAQNETTQGILSIIANTESDKSLIEQSRYNSERLLRISFDKNFRDILSGVTDILSYNHIADKDFTHQRVLGVVTASHNERIRWLNNFKYKGTRLGELADAESWITDKVKLVEKYIYAEKRTPQTLMRDLDLLYKEYVNQLKL